MPTLYLRAALLLPEGPIVRLRYTPARLSALALALSMSNAALACKDNMAFRADKQVHFAASAAIGSAALLITEDTRIAMATGIGIGLAKEIADAHSSTGCSSVHDLAYDVLGTAFGTYGTNWIIRHDFIGYRTSF